MNGNDYGGSYNYNNPNSYNYNYNNPNNYGSNNPMASTPSPPPPTQERSAIVPPPIVYTIAGSDSGGGAGIQADLHAIRSMGCHGCTAVTCLTAQNSVGVSDVHTPPPSFLAAQLDALFEDMPPSAIKVGMLPNEDLAATVAGFVRKVKDEFERRRGDGSGYRKVWVVLDPVMVSTSGHELIDETARQAIVQELFPVVDVVTPNLHEAEALLGRKLETPTDVELGAREIIQKLGAKAVLIKGGHSVSREHAQDFFLSSYDQEDMTKEPRLCDGRMRVWLRSRRYDTEDTHGTGCTLSSAIASALALGESSRNRYQELLRSAAAADGGADGERSRRGSRSSEDDYSVVDRCSGTITSILPVDACCLAKAYVTAGISRGTRLGRGPGPVVHTGFPSAFRHFPTIIPVDATDLADGTLPPFRPIQMWRDDQRVASTLVPKLGRILPIVDTAEWLERLCAIGVNGGVTDVQLRIKDESVAKDPALVLDTVKRCQAACERVGVRLWINDYWEAAVEARCFGVHLGQEDLLKCAKSGGLMAMIDAGVALGISTHTYGELAAALGVQPSYVSLGPIFETGSKNVQFDSQGLRAVSNWRRLIPPHVPLVAIGGIGDAETARRVREAGADCCAVIGAVINANDPATAVSELNEAMR